MSEETSKPAAEPVEPAAAPSEPIDVVADEIHIHGFQPTIDLDAVRHAIELIKAGEWTRQKRMQLLIEISWFVGCGAAMFGGGELIAEEPAGAPLDLTHQSYRELVQLVEANLPADNTAAIGPGQWIQIALALYELFKRFSQN